MRYEREAGTRYDDDGNLLISSFRILLPSFSVFAHAVATINGETRDTRIEIIVWTYALIFLVFTVLNNYH